jgi:hypothetical protein
MRWLVALIAVSSDMPRHLARRRASCKLPPPKETTMRPALAALALLPLLAACTLVDQRTFEPAAAAPGAEELARATAQAAPVASIRLDQAADWRPALAETARAAAQRRPEAGFDIHALVPTQAPPAEQDRRVAQAIQDARAVAEAMAAAGLPPDRLRLGLRGDPGSPAREVRVFQR